jgi:hypothetical protein
MSGIWTEIETGTTGTTQYTIAKLIDEEGADFTLRASQSLPIIDPPTPNATTVPHSVAGDGNGLTISYQVATAPVSDINVVLDINNDITGISTEQMAGSITTNVTSVTNIGTITLAPSSVAPLGGTGATFTLTSSTVGVANIITSVVGSGTTGQGYALGNVVTFTAGDLTPGFGATVGNLVLTLQSANLDVANPSWVETAASHTSGTGSAFVASKNSYRAARIRTKAGTAAFAVSTIRLMTDS